MRLRCLWWKVDQAEYEHDPLSGTSTLLREYIWMEGEAVGVVENDQLFFIRTDHIGRPVFATDELGGKPPAVVYWLRKNETQPDQQEQKVA